jgi:rod shape determining protein RodA
MAKGDFIRQMPESASAFGKRPPLAARLHIDVPLLAILLAIAAFGLTVLYSASGGRMASVMRQSVYFGLGLLAMFTCAQISLPMVRRWAPWGYAGGVLLLIAVDIAGIGAKGAQRWLEIPGLPRFQPSEIMKLLVPPSCRRASRTCCWRLRS